MFQHVAIALFLLLTACGRLSFDSAGSSRDSGAQSDGSGAEDANQAEVDASLAQGPCPSTNSDALAIYNFDGPNLATDLLGNHNGVVVGTPTSETAQPGCGSAMRIADLSSYVTIPDSDAWDTLRSVRLWVRLDANPAATAVLLGRDATGFDDPGHLSIMVGPDRRVIGRLQNQTEFFACSSPIDLGVWTDVVFNIGPPAIEIRINGVVQDSESGAFSYPGDISSFIGNCDLAGSAGMGVNDNPWTFGVGSEHSNEGASTPVANPFNTGLVDHIVISSERQ